MYAVIGQPSGEKAVVAGEVDGHARDGPPLLRLLQLAAGSAGGGAFPQSTCHVKSGGGGAALGATWTTEDDGVRHRVHALGSHPERADRVGELLRLDRPSRSHAPPRERLGRTRLGSHHLGRMHKGRCQQAPHALLSRCPLGDDVGVLDEVEVEVSEAPS